MNFSDFQYFMLGLRDKFKEYKKLKNTLFDSLEEMHCIIEDNVDKDGDYEHCESIEDSIKNFIEAKDEEDLVEIWKRIQADIPIHSPK